jgi:hypothetical protein
MAKPTANMLSITTMVVADIKPMVRRRPKIAKLVANHPLGNSAYRIQTQA